MLNDPEISLLGVNTTHNPHVYMQMLKVAVFIIANAHRVINKCSRSTYSAVKRNEVHYKSLKSTYCMIPLA